MTLFGDTVPLEAVRETFVAIDCSPLEVYDHTGLTPAWQQAFKASRAKDPGYTKICTLLTWLVGPHAPAGASMLLKQEMQKVSS